MDDRWWRGTSSGSGTRSRAERCAWLALIAVGLTGAAAGCYVNPEACETDDDCFKFEQCRRGTCVPAPDTSSPDGGPGDTADSRAADSDSGPRDVGDTADESDTADRGDAADGSDTADGRDTADQCIRTTDAAFCEGAPCDYDDKSEGVCTGQSYDEHGNCEEPDAFEPAETTVGDGLDNDCDGYVDDVFSDLSMGDLGDVACGIRRTDGSMICWGSRSPEGISSVPAESDIDAVRPGSSHACAVDADGNLTCWGEDTGVGRVEKTPSDGSFVEPCVAGQRSCGLRTSGRVACWGLGEDPDSPIPDFATISCGGAGECGLTTRSEMKCWRNDVGRQDTFPPDGDWAELSVGAHHVCGVAGSGDAVECWGTSIQKDEPLNPPDGGGLSDIDVGDNFACGITDEGVLRCWVAAEHPDPLPAPSRVESESFHSPAAGQNSMCALTDDGRALCWGSICDDKQPPCSAP